MTLDLARYACLIAIAGLLLTPVLPIMQVENTDGKKDYMVQYDINTAKDTLPENALYYFTHDKRDVGVSLASLENGVVVSSTRLFKAEKLEDTELSFKQMDIFEGHVYMAAQSQRGSASSTTIQLMKYNTRGLELWSRTVGGGFSENFVDMAFHDGMIYLISSTISSLVSATTYNLYSFDTQGDQLDKQNLAGIFGDGNVVIDAEAACVYFSRQESNELRIGKYSFRGLELWGLRMTDVSVKSITTQGNDTYLMGRNSGGESFIAKYNSRGELIWSGGGVDPESDPSSFMVNEDSIYVLGEKQPNRDEVILSKYSTDGMFEWSKKWSSVSSRFGIRHYPGGMQQYGENIIILAIAEDSSTSNFNTFFVFFNEEGDVEWESGVLEDYALLSDSMFYISSSQENRRIIDSAFNLRIIQVSMAISLAISLALLMSINIFYSRTKINSLKRFSEAVFMSAGPIMFISSAIGVLSFMSLFDSANNISASTSFSFNYIPIACLISLIGIGSLSTYFVTRESIHQKSEDKGRKIAYNYDLGDDMGNGLDVTPSGGLPLDTSDRQIKPASNEKHPAMQDTVVSPSAKKRRIAKPPTIIITPSDYGPGYGGVGDGVGDGGVGDDVYEDKPPAAPPLDRLEKADSRLTEDRLDEMLMLGEITEEEYTKTIRALRAKAAPNGNNAKKKTSSVSPTTVMQCTNCGEVFNTRSGAPKILCPGCGQIVREKT